MTVTDPVTTTTKSIMFQTFLRYEPLCRTKPKATILNNASTQKIPRKYTSVSSCQRQANNGVTQVMHLTACDVFVLMDSALKQIVEWRAIYGRRLQIELWKQTCWKLTTAWSRIWMKPRRLSHIKSLSSIVSWTKTFKYAVTWPIILQDSMLSKKIFYPYLNFWHVILNHKTRVIEWS